MKHKPTFSRSILLLFFLISSILVAQTITVTAPNGGEYWLPGSTHSIGWTESGLTGDAATGVDLEYFNGTVWVSIASGIAVTDAPTTYSWSVPNISTTVALVRVTEVGGTIGGATDVSDAVFTIHQPILGIPTLTTPADLATKVSLNPTLGWDENTDVLFDTEDAYEVVISTDQWFTSIVYTNSAVAYGGVSTTLDLTGLFTLESNTKYYWRVKALRTTAPTAESPWSSIFVFTTTPATVTPTQTFPISGNIVYSNLPTLYWYTGVWSNDQLFEVYYGTSGIAAPISQSAVGTSGTGVGTFITSGTIGTTTNYTLTVPLASNTDYDWWVRSTDGVNRSEWSTMGEFSTSSTNGGPVKPVGTYPTLGEDQYTNNPYLYWYIITQVTGLDFEVYVSTSNAVPNVPTDVVTPPTVGGTSVFYDFSTVGTNYYYQLSGLVSSETYYWWVRSTDGGTNYSDWSDEYSFTTTSTTGSPVKPVLTYPADGETVYFADVSLHWYATTIATDLKYNLYWSDNGTLPATPTPNQTGITDLFTSITGLLANTTYYWWVQSTDNAGANGSDWSDRGDFYTSATAAAVQVPVQMYPTGGITISGTSVDLSWAYFGDVAGITYEAEYSLYPDMTLPQTITMTVAGATSETLSGLLPGTTYYWHVRATDGSITSAWAGPAQFSTWASAVAPVVVPMVGSPVANAVIDTDSPELSWFLPTQSEGLTYELQYSLSGDFADAKEINDISTTSVGISDIVDGTKHYWRVRSKDNSGNVSIYSAIGSFIGQGITDVTEPGIIPEKFEVSQNYPNPFNPSTVIKYSLPEAEFVTISIYNVLGQKVSTLLKEEVQAGVHNITWNGVDNSGAKVATGTYIYRVVAGNNIMTKKMILLK